MSGMQDVATLAERYNNLSSNAEKFHKNISRLKKEVQKGK
jgi:prefoldin subunit 5